MNATRRSSLLKQREVVKADLNLASGVWSRYSYRSSLERIEKRIVSEFPKNELPILIGILETPLAKKLLEARLK